jgi:hypothetical protein
MEVYGFCWIDVMFLFLAIENDLKELLELLLNMKGQGVLTFPLMIYMNIPKHMYNVPPLHSIV